MHYKCLFLYIRFNEMVSNYYYITIYYCFLILDTVTQKLIFRRVYTTTYTCNLEYQYIFHNLH